MHFKEMYMYSYIYMYMHTHTYIVKKVNDEYNVLDIYWCKA